MFLLLFSYVILCDFNTIGKSVNKDTNNSYLPLSILEIVLIIWVFTYFCEEFRKFIMNETKLIWPKFKNYFFQNWNGLTMLSIILYFVAIILRFIPNDSCFLAARIILSIDIIFWYLKSLRAYWFLKNFGPMLILIEQMVLQLIYYTIILALFIFAFGVSTQALMYPNQKLDKNLLKNIFYPGFFVTAKEYYTRSSIMNGKLFN